MCLTKSSTYEIHTLTRRSNSSSIQGAHGASALSCLCLFLRTSVISAGLRIRPSYFNLSNKSLSNLYHLLHFGEIPLVYCVADGENDCQRLFPVTAALGQVPNT